MSPFGRDAAAGARTTLRLCPGFGERGRLARRLSLRCLFAGLHLAADAFGFAEDSENVATQNLADVVGAVAAVE